MFFLNIRDKNKWAEIKENDNYKNFREDLKRNYLLYCRDKEVSFLKFSDEFEYLKTGNRDRYQTPYFNRRIQMSIYAIYAMLYPENNEYLEKLQDVICAICDEYTWILPAHRVAESFNYKHIIDLFAGETGLYLSEIKYMLIDRLNPIVVDRITEKLEERILSNFENYGQGFESSTANWAAVCGGSIGITFLYENPQRFVGVRERIEKCMDNYLSGILEDGACTEGVSYWNYGFSFFVMYHDILRQRSYGWVDKFNNAKVEKLASFFTNMVLDENNMVSFADSSSKIEYNRWLIHFLKNEYGINMPPQTAIKLDYTKFSCAVRDLFYYNSAFDNEKFNQESESYYEKLQCYIKKNKNFGFAIKGGNNKEEHNHNDIGSFIIVNNGKQVMCDLGAGRYTAQYFGADRYTLLNTSSLGHNVPIINGQAQRFGIEYYGDLKVNGNVVTVDLKNAYPVKIDKFERTVIIYDDKISFSDTFDDSINVTERFVTEIKPIVKGGKILIDKTVLSFDESVYSIRVNEDVWQKNKSEQRMVYLIDIELKNKISKFSMDIEFKREEK